MGSGGWKYRKAEASGYEVGKVYYQVFNHPLAGIDEHAPRWVVAAYEYLGESKHYVQIKRVEGPGSGVAYVCVGHGVLKPWTAYPTPEAAVDAKVAGLDRLIDAAHGTIARAEWDKISLNDFRSKIEGGLKCPTE